MINHCKKFLFNSYPYHVFERLKNLSLFLLIITLWRGSINIITVFTLALFKFWVYFFRLLTHQVVKHVRLFRRCYLQLICETNVILLDGTVWCETTLKVLMLVCSVTLHISMTSFVKRWLILLIIFIHLLYVLSTRFYLKFRDLYILIYLIHAVDLL